MFETVLLYTAAFVGALHLFSAVVLRYAMRFCAKCTPMPASLDDLPEAVASVIAPRIPELNVLGFQNLGTYDCGTLTSGTRSYAAYFYNPATCDSASVTAMATSEGVASYIEFSTRFATGLVVETNTNGLAPLTPDNSEHRVFRFPNFSSADVLYGVHRQLTEKYAPGLWAEAEPKGEELSRFVHVIENFGPRHTRMGYLVFAGDEQTYRLTWKGAFLMASRGLWPVSLVRRISQRHAMQAELESLEVRGVATLQKA
ncbi:MAG TPA: hypothetical protein VMH89_06045 [Candidatus Acidoferrum sp.]|nr:hypothetical protein [Candidatus Acidoferrum sp.]